MARASIDYSLSPIRAKTHFDLTTAAKTLLDDSPLANDEVLYSGFRTPSYLQSKRSSPTN